MNVYTGLLFCAVVALAVGCGFMWMAAKGVSPNPGNPFEIQKTGSGAKIVLPPKK